MTGKSTVVLVIEAVFSELSYILKGEMYQPAQLLRSVADSLSHQRASALLTELFQTQSIFR